MSVVQFVTSFEQIEIMLVLIMVVSSGLRHAHTGQEDSQSSLGASLCPLT